MATTTTVTLAPVQFTTFIAELVHACFRGDVEIFCDRTGLEESWVETVMADTLRFDQITQWELWLLNSHLSSIHVAPLASTRELANTFGMEFDRLPLGKMVLCPAPRSLADYVRKLWESYPGDLASFCAETGLEEVWVESLLEGELKLGEVTQMDIWHLASYVQPVEVIDLRRAARELAVTFGLDYDQLSSWKWFQAAA